MTYTVTYDLKSRQAANKVMTKLCEDASVSGITETAKTVTTFDAKGDMKAFTEQIKIVASVVLDEK